MANFAATLAKAKGYKETRFHALEYLYEQKSKMILVAIGDKKGEVLPKIWTGI